MQAGKGRGPCRGSRRAGPGDHRASEPDQGPQAGPLSWKPGPPSTPGSPGPPAPPTSEAGSEERAAEGARDSAQHRECQRARQAGWARPSPLVGGGRPGRGRRGPAERGLRPAAPPAPSPAPAARARGARAAGPVVRGLSGQQARGAGSLTGLRRLSVTFFQSSSCSWCRKPMAGPRSGRLRAAARSSARPAGPAARRSVRHRPRGGGVSAPGTGSTLAPPRRPQRQPLAPAPRLHRPPLKGAALRSTPRPRPGNPAQDPARPAPADPGALPHHGRLPSRPQAAHF